MNYRAVVEELEDVEDEIKGYQEFLGDLRLTYVECGEGCKESAGAGRSIDPGYLEDLYGGLSFQDNFLEAELDRAESVQARRLRRLTKHCREILAEKRETREGLIEARKQLERKVAFGRHPKKDTE